MLQRCIFLLLTLSFSVIQYAHASTDLKSIDVAAFVYPPFSYQDKKGQWQGADIEITSAALKKMGYQANYLARPFKRLILDLKEGNVPMSIPIVEGNNRESFVYFSKPISYLYNVLWKRKDRDLQWTTYEDLNGLKVGATKGYHYGAGFKEAGESGVFTLEYMADAQPELKNFKKTDRKRIDMFICEINVGRYIQNQHKPSFEGIDYALTGVGPKRPFSAAISRKYYRNNSTEAEALIREFNTALSVLAKAGETKRIFAKYNMDIEMDKNNQLILEENWRQSAEGK